MSVATCPAVSRRLGRVFRRGPATGTCRASGPAAAPTVEDKEGVRACRVRRGRAAEDTDEFLDKVRYPRNGRRTLRSSKPCLSGGCTRESSISRSFASVWRWVRERMYPTVGSLRVPLLPLVKLGAHVELAAITAGANARCARCFLTHVLSTIIRTSPLRTRPETRDYLPAAVTLRFEFLHRFS